MSTPAAKRWYFKISAPIFAASLLGGCVGAVSPDDEGEVDPRDPPAGAGGKGGGGASVPQGGGAGPSGFAPVKDAVPIEARVWRLTRAQYNNTVADLLGDRTAPATSFVQEPGGTGFANAEENLGLSAEFMDQASKAAVQLAADTLKDPARTKAFLDPCLETQAESEPCVKGFVAKFGRRAFRRPLTADEEGAYLALYTKNKGALGGKLAAQLVLEAMLQSPHFLFRAELGEGKPDARGLVPLGRYEIAAQLSYYLTNSMPDAELAAAAESGAISKRDELAKQALRLVETERAKAVVWELFRQVLSYDTLPAADDKKGSVAKEYAAARGSLAKETETFVREALWGAGEGTLGTLLAANHTYVDSALAPIYGVADPGAGKWAKVMLDGKDRAGFLTHPGLMAVLSHGQQTSPVLRGVFVSERLFCRELPQPPPEADTTPPKLDPGKTTRQRYEALTERAEPCLSCHKVVNPPGWAFEHLDWIGKVRRDENKLPVDTTTELVASGDADGRYANIGEMARAMANSAAVRACMARQVYRFATGQHEHGGNGAAIDEMVAAFEKSGWKVKSLLLSHVLSERFVTRKAAR